MCFMKSIILKQLYPVIGILFTAKLAAKLYSAAATEKKQNVEVGYN